MKVKALFNKVKHFPEFHNMIDSLETNRKAEQNIIEGHQKAYGSEYKSYAQKQKGDLPQYLTNMSDVGQSEISCIQDTFQSLSSFNHDLQTLLEQETEMSKLIKNYELATEQATKSRQAQEKAESGVNKAKLSGNPGNLAKAEALLQQAQRKYEADAGIAKEQKERLAQLENPYQIRFLESYITPLSAMFNLRMKTCEKLIEIADNYKTAAEKLHDFDDDEIPKIQEELEKVEALLTD